MVDHKWLSSKFFDPHAVKDKGYVPAVLDWRVNATCKSVKGNNDSTSNTSTSFCGTNARCSVANQSSGVTCACDRGYEGNPYLPEGCQDVVEDAIAYPNGTACIFRKNASVSCFRYKFINPRRPRMVLAGILAGVGTLLLVICA